MLTPAFELSQDDTFLYVNIEIPYAKLSDMDIFSEDYDFIFHSKPYYLRLNLPGKVIYCEKPTVQYDVDKRKVTVTLTKSEVGETFQGLDFITSLLAPRKNTSCRPTTSLIEVIGETDDNQESDEEFDWLIPQVPPDPKTDDLKLCSEQCGFANSYSFSVFRLKEQTNEIFDVRDPQNKTPEVRFEERLSAETEKFDVDYYFSDLFENEDVQHILKYHPFWLEMYEQQKNTSEDRFIFTSEEKDRLRKLPNKEYLLDKSQKKLAMLGLLDIIFAFAYNKRTTEGENTVESPWTINKLSATLSWLETFSSVPNVIHACVRRSLCYPLYRHFGLTVTTLEDVHKIFSLGKKCILKCLLEIHEMFCTSEPRYILNDLYITDYCVWVQSKGCSSNMIEKLASTLEKMLQSKDYCIGAGSFEHFAFIAWDDHMESNQSFKEDSTKLASTKSDSDSERGKTKYNVSENQPADPLCSKFEKLNV